MKRLLVLLILMALVMSGTAHAGGVKEILLGAGFGTAFGVSAGGIALTFAEKPDEVYPQYLLIGGSAGLVCGIVFGIFIPADKPEPQALLNFDPSERRFSLSPYGILPDFAASRKGASLEVRSRLFRLDF